MNRFAPLAACLLIVGAAGAADLTKIERRIANEPAYKTKTPRYALLVIGPEARDRVWLVHDGDDLHVLADKPVKLSANKRGSAENGYDYELADLTINGRTHHNLRVGVQPVKRWAFAEFAKHLGMLAAMKKSPESLSLTVGLDVVAPHIKPKGTVSIMAGPIDLEGPLVLADKPADAPIIHMAGPLAVTFYTGKPTLKRERGLDVVTVVGTPGLGAGSFAMVQYLDTIPESAHPKMEVAFAPAKPGDAPVKKLYELRQRC